MDRTRFHYTGQYLAIAERDNWEFATRINALGVVVLVPVTDQGELVLVEQFRIPVGKHVIELPAGLVGDGDYKDESLQEAAHRELKEETGYSAGRMTLLLKCPSTAGLSDELITFYLAEDLDRTGPGGGDVSEDIEVHHVPLDTAAQWLAERQASGVYLDPKTYAALYWLERRARGFKPLPAAKG